MTLLFRHYWCQGAECRHEVRSSCQIYLEFSSWFLMKHYNRDVFFWQGSWFWNDRRGSFFAPVYSLVIFIFFPVWSSACVCVQVCLHVFLKSVVCLYLKDSSRRKENLHWWLEMETETLSLCGSSACTLCYLLFFDKFWLQQ